MTMKLPRVTDHCTIYRQTIDVTNAVKILPKIVKIQKKVQKAFYIIMAWHEVSAQIPRIITQILLS